MSHEPKGINAIGPQKKLEEGREEMRVGEISSAIKTSLNSASPFCPCQQPPFSAQHTVEITSLCS